MGRPNNGATSTSGWMPPRGGGYRPGKNTLNATFPARPTPPGPPPVGPAGASKAALVPTRYKHWRRLREEERSPAPPEWLPPPPPPPAGRGGVTK
jgi:hypothetical protein